LWINYSAQGARTKNVAGDIINTFRAYNRYAKLSDLRDSGSIEQDADVVMFIHREDKYNELSDKKNIAEIIIAKHRNGPTGEAELFFDDAKVSFHTIEKSDFGNF
jgi:replicative DNA helicase